MKFNFFTFELNFIMKKIIVVFALIILIASCKKYPEGPSLSLRSKTERLSNTWRFTKVLEDGVDKTSDYQTVFKDYKITINKDGSYSISYTGFGILSYTENGNWTFNGDKTYVGFDPTSNSNSNWDVKILKLMENELWVLDENNNGKKIEYHLQP